MSGDEPHSCEGGGVCAGGGSNNMFVVCHIFTIKSIEQQSNSKHAVTDPERLISFNLCPVFVA